MANRTALQEWPREHARVRWSIPNDNLCHREVRRPQLPRTAGVWRSRIPRQRASPGVAEFKEDALLPKSGPQHEKGTGARERLRAYFLPKMPVDKVNRIRIAKILAGDLSLDRGRADRYSLGCHNVETFGPLLRSNLMLMRLSSTRSTVDAYLVRRGHCVSSRLSPFVPFGRESKVFPCRL